MLRSKDGPDAPSIAYRRMEWMWKMVDTLRGGTKAMRDAGTDYLPKETKEKPRAYEIRRDRSFLYPAYKDSILRVLAKPFSRAITTTGGDLPERLDPLMTNADFEGRDINEFGYQLLDDGVNYGKAHFLVDFPNTGGRQITVAEERQDGGLRPYFVRISPTDLLSWKFERDASGRKRLTQIRFAETRVLPEGDFGEVEVRFIRAINADGTWRLWREEKNGSQFIPDPDTPEGTHTFKGVPLVTLYTNQTGPLEAEPPLLELAWLNVAHWQSMSDQRNILRYARVAILFLKGLEEKAEIVIGPLNSIRTENADADGKFIEHTGKAIEAGEKDLERLEERMETLGLQPFIRQLGNQTAKARTLDETKHHTSVQMWAVALQKALTKGAELAADWLNISLVADFAFNVHTEFGLTQKAAETVTALLKAREKREITRQTFLERMKHFDILPDTLDVEEEIELLEAEESKALEAFTQPEEDEEEDDGQPE